MPPRLDPVTLPWARPVILEGSLVRLEPLALAHLDGLAEVGLEPSIWRYMPIQPRTVHDFRAWLETALRNAATGLELPFATINLATGRPIGSTRFMAIAPEHRRLEIGWTWLAVRAQGTGANREAKRLMLAHAFDDLGANRVELKTDAENARSRAAILALGATFERIARNHMILPGRVRHSAWYSVIVDEWPSVREHLRLVSGGSRLPSSAASASPPPGGTK